MPYSYFITICFFANEIFNNEDKVKEYINSISKIDETLPMLKICVGYLTDWENSWYITMNRENMYQPTPREGQLDRLTQNEFIFSTTEEKTTHLIIDFKFYFDTLSVLFHKIIIKFYEEGELFCLI